MSETLVSVVVPVYNGERYLGACLESLLAQDHPAIEVIVVDDGSTDGSAAVAASFERVRTVCRPHEGLGATRNAGIAAATGALIGFCDADDLWKPNKARLQVEYLEAHPEIDLVLCRQDTMFEAGVAHPDWLIPDQLHGDLDGVSPTSALFRRAVFDRLHYDTSMQNGSDFALLVRARAAGFGIALLQESLRVRRIHGENMMHREGPAKAQMLATVRAHLRSRR